MPILFDVGANVGKYTRLLRKNSPDAQIHSFEPGRKTFEMLDGATHMLEENRIKMIQFEFGGCHIDSRTFFRDFWNRLHESYRIYRILRDGFAEIPVYEECEEIFVYQNIFCEMREEIQNCM